MCCLGRLIIALVGGLLQEQRGRIMVNGIKWGLGGQKFGKMVQKSSHFVNEKIM